MQRKLKNKENKGELFRPLRHVVLFMHICKRASQNLSPMQKNRVADSDGIDEVCVIEEDENRGITLEFSRRLPLR